MAANNSLDIKTADGSPNAETESKPRYWQGILTALELRLLSTFLVLLSLIILLIAVTTNHWIGDGQMSIGLWRACLRPKCKKTPNYIQTVSAPLVVAQGMFLTASLTAFFALFILGASFRLNRIRSTSLAQISGLDSITTGIFVIGGMSVYTVEFLLKRSKAPMATDFEWSYGAGWASAPFFFLAGSVTLQLPKIEN